MRCSVWNVCRGCVSRLTLGLLTLAWGLPANAGAMLIQVEESHQSFGPCLQLHHLRPRLHHAHASLHCGPEKRKKHIINKIINCKHALHRGVEGTGAQAWFDSGGSKAKCHRVRQLAEQLMRVSVQNCNRDATVSAHRAAFSHYTLTCCWRQEREWGNKRRSHKRRHRCCLSLSLSFSLCKKNSFPKIAHRKGKAGQIVGSSDWIVYVPAKEMSFKSVLEPAWFVLCPVFFHYLTI